MDRSAKFLGSMLPKIEENALITPVVTIVNTEVTVGVLFMK